MSKLKADQFQKICFVRTGGPGDANAFERGLRLCQRTNAELSIVGVAEVPPAGILQLLASCGVSADVTSSTSDQTLAVEQLVEMARQQGVQATGEILQGSDALQVIRKIQQEGHDLLIKAAQPSTTIRHMMFGHADFQLVRKCPCPVWIEKPSGAASYDRILAAVDPAPFQDEFDFDPQREELNTSILQMAVMLAQLENAVLHVVHVWNFALEGPLQSRADFTAQRVAEVGNSFKKQHEQALSDLLEPFMPHISRVHLLKGQASDEISRLAVRENMDVVVMGTMCRTGIAGWLIGNTAETVLNQIESSVVALKPSGFVSSVRVD